MMANKLFFLHCLAVISFHETSETTEMCTGLEKNKYTKANVESVLIKHSISCVAPSFFVLSCGITVGYCYTDVLTGSLTT